MVVKVHRKSQTNKQIKESQQFRIILIDKFKAINKMNVISICFIIIFIQIYQHINDHFQMTRKEIQAAEEIMRIAINKQNHVDSLIGYYRDQIDKFNDQRIQWSLYYQICKENVANRHLLERELNYLNNANIDLQNLLSGLKGDLTYERQKYFHKIEQSQQIKATLQENKKKLRELTEICKPLINNQLQKSKVNKNNHNIEQSANKSSYSVRTNAFQQQKSIFKNDKLSSKRPQSQTQTLQTQLELKLINMSKNHQQAKMKLSQQIQQLKEQLEDIVSEHSHRRQECSSQYKEALEKLTDLQKKHHNLVSEFFKYRMNGIQQQQKTHQQNEVIRLKNLFLAQKLKQLQQSHTQELNSVENHVKLRNKQFKLKYDEQLRKKQEHLSILKQQHQRIADIYLNKLKKLEAQLRTTTEKTKTIEEKTKTQVSSLKSQIKILTNRLQNVAMNQMKSDLVPNNEQESEDDSSVTLEMEQLDRINKEVKQLQKQLDTSKK